MSRRSQVRLLAVADQALTAASAEEELPDTIPKPPELTWWDWAVFLLHTAAEIEHALMAQYLYAAYSLADTDFAGTSVPADATERTGNWRTTIVSVAREEMAHLLTEQNLLRFIGGPLNLEREDFPFRSTLYPFPLTLQPLTKTSLAKYIAAQMPADPAAPDIDSIIARATEGAGGTRPNRVGLLFDTLANIFEDPNKLADADLQPQTAVDHQAAPFDWFGFGRLIVHSVDTRDEAVAALRAIGEQGEGSASVPPEAQPSHFDEFLRIFREFPETETGPEPEWVPTRSVPTNPTTRPDPDPDPDVERHRITHPTTRLWAQLFNVRYRMVLVDLAHALQTSGPLIDATGTSTTRGHLRDWAFLGMRGQGLAGLRGLGQTLTVRPTKAVATAGAPAHAGAPFELPYTLAIPDAEHDRWRLHRSLLETSRELAASLRAAGESGPLLEEIDSIDTDQLAVVQAQLVPV